MRKEEKWRGGMRRNDREIHDLTFIKRLLETCRVCRIGMVDQGKPYVLPINYGYVLKERQLTFYLHSASFGRKVEIFKNNPQVCVEIDQAETLVGEGEIACRYGYLYESLIGMGTIFEITDLKEKQFGLELLMKHMTGRDGYQYNGLETVNVYKIVMDDYSVKANQKD